MDVPNPGSVDALDQGCICPVLDNEYGEGYMGQPGIFVFNMECSVHVAELEATEENEWHL